MSLYRDEAVVLRTWKLGEADRIVSLHTHTYGKVRGVAKGVRRTRSKFGARLEPAALVSVQLYQGRSELHTITQAETINLFVRLRNDPYRFARASAMLEAVDQLSPDQEPDSGRHVMLTRALATLNSSKSTLVVAAFFLKLLVHEGVRPEFDVCVTCGADQRLTAIDFVQGGVLCQRCRRGRPVSSEALELLRLIVGGGLATALQHRNEAAAAEVDSLASEAMELHVERRLRSLAVLRNS